MRLIQARIKRPTKSFSKIKKKHIQEKKGNCYVRGKPGHFANKCRYKNGDHKPPKAIWSTGKILLPLWWSLKRT